VIVFTNAISKINAKFDAAIIIHVVNVVADDEASDVAINSKVERTGTDIIGEGCRGENAL